MGRDFVVQGGNGAGMSVNGLGCVWTMKPVQNSTSEIAEACFPYRPFMMLNQQWQMYLRQKLFPLYNKKPENNQRHANNRKTQVNSGAVVTWINAHKQFITGWMFRQNVVTAAFHHTCLLINCAIFMLLVRVWIRFWSPKTGHYFCNIWFWLTFFKLTALWNYG